MGCSSEDPGYIFSTHMAAHTTMLFHCSFRGRDDLFWPLQMPGMPVVQRYTCRQNIHIRKIKANVFVCFSRQGFSM